MVIKLDAFTRASPKAPGSRASAERDGARAVWVGVATLGLAAFGPSLAMAQAAGGDTPLTIGLQAVTTYDTNPARGSALAAQLRGLHKNDVLVSPGLTVDYAHGMGLQQLNLKGVFGYDYHANNTKLNREHIDLSADATKSLGSRCSIHGGASYLRAQSDLQSLAVTVTKNTVQTYDIDAGGTCGTGAGLTENLQFTRSAVHNSDAAVVDFNTTGVSGSVGYSNEIVGRLGLVASYRRTDYVNIPITSINTPNSLDATSFGVNLTRPIGARLSGSAAVFYTHSSQNRRTGAPTTGQTSFSGLTANAGLTYLIGPRLQLSTHLARDIGGSTFQNVGYSVTSRADLSADYTVSSRITTSLGGSWSRNSYRGRLVVIPQTTPEWQELATFYGRVSVKIGRSSAISADVSHAQGRADLSLYDYTSNRVSLTLSTSF
jgi:hypothetical protein